MIFIQILICGGVSDHLVRLFCVAFSKATARRAGDSAFLLLAFLCARFVKEKRLKTFGIKGATMLFLLKQEGPLFLA
jgi:hypothetical protein